ncbi:Transposase [Caenorhabditis elegans]|uniref:Transposase n=1 Tax=Caenorhabditis elegans TaxID=6239 RepID=G3MTY2_CAEEL|nr:Transposase [Caenorhabditis elegans]CCD31117.1 Transposase [Caenorhabditis elegans]|eukprot:NP_001254229.1 Uncharacterized protein CELE_T10B9.14 [Caenorhabditis elegans]
MVFKNPRHTEKQTHMLNVSSTYVKTIKDEPRIQNCSGQKY